jgi:hypothetical protein
LKSNGAVMVGYIASYVFGAATVIGYVWLIRRLTSHNYQYECTLCDDFRFSTNDKETFDYALLHMAMPHLDDHQENN